MNIRTATAADIAARQKVQFISKVPCVFPTCGQPVPVKDIRQRDKTLCFKHSMFRSSMEKNRWFRGTQKTKEERLAVVKHDPTVSNGGQNGYFKANKGV